MGILFSVELEYIRTLWNTSELSRRYGVMWSNTCGGLHAKTFMLHVGIFCKCVLFYETRYRAYRFLIFIRNPGCISSRLLLLKLSNHRTNVDLRLIFIPLLNEVDGRYTGFTLSVRLPVCPSVCGQNRVCSVSSIILAGSISYLHILSSTFRRCVAFIQTSKIWRLFLDFVLFLLLTWDPIWTGQYWGGGGGGGGVLWSQAL